MFVLYFRLIQKPLFWDPFWDQNVICFGAVSGTTTQKINAGAALDHFCIVFDRFFSVFDENTKNDVWITSGSFLYCISELSKH